MTATKTLDRRYYVMLVMLMSVFFILSIATVSFGELILDEDFEWSADDWPWSTSDTQEWIIRPDPPGVGPLHTWGVDSGEVYHPDGNPRHRQCIWCASLPDDLIPGTDTYPENMDAWAAWGPFDIIEEDIDVAGVFYAFGCKEPYWDGAGDNFALLVTDDFNNIDNRIYDNCCIAYQLIGERIDNAWAPVEFDLAELDSAGEEVSYLPFQDEEGDWHTRSDIWIAFVFQSNNTEHNNDLGFFVDDFVLSSYDGLYDFEMQDMVYQHPDDSSRYSTIYASNPIQFQIGFRTVGPEPEEECSHILYIDPDPDDDEDIWELPFDTLRGTWESNRWGVNHVECFTRTWVPTAQDTGWVIFAVALDDDEEIDESDENNNTLIDTVFINQGQTPPELVWIRPSADDDTLITDSTSLTIIFEAFNSPDDEYASVSFFYDTQPGSDTGIRINSGSYREILNGEDSFVWDMSDLASDTYYLYAEMNDTYYNYIYSYSPVPIVFLNDVPERDNLNIPLAFEITGVYPNPFNPTVEITIAIPQAGDINAKWYSLDGRMVDSKILRGMQPGYHKLTWTPDNLASGMYLLNLSSPMGKMTAKVIYLK